MSSKTDFKFQPILKTLWLVKQLAKQNEKYENGVWVNRLYNKLFSFFFCELFLFS
jgi:hypothetical protein